MSYAVHIPFAGSTLTGIMRGDCAYVAMRPIVEGMGLDWSRQRKKMMDDEVLSSVVGEKATTGADGKQYVMLCLPFEYLQGWLFTVNPKKVRPEIRERVIEYKKQCYRVLHAALTEQTQDRTQAIADKRAAARLITDILQEVRSEQGKATAAHHFSNEHRLCNAALTGKFAALNEAALNANEARLLARIRRRDAVLIARGVDYPKRKTVLMDFARAIVCDSLPTITQGKVTRKDLRPHDYAQIWPDLATENQPKEAL